MARKNKAKKSQPIRDRTPVASRRVQNTRSYSPDRPVGPALAFQVRRTAEPNLRVTVKRKNTMPIYSDVKTSLRRGAVPLAPLAPSRKPPVAAKQKRATIRKPMQVSTEPRRQSMLSLAPSTPEPDARKSSIRARDLPVCKKRPDSKKAARSKGGGGGRKSFVPWC